jgi:hypothetical protein
LPSLGEDLIHDLGALGERGADLVAVDRLCGGRPIVTDQLGDVLYGHAVGGHDRHEGVPELSRRPVLAETCLLGDYPERADDVVRAQRRADPGREDQAVLLPEFTESRDVTPDEIIGLSVPDRPLQ